MKKISIVFVTIALIFGGLPTANAASMVITASKTANLATDEVIGISLSNFPSKSGMYLQQCIEPASGARPAACNGETQLWITNAMGGSFKPNAAISMRLVAKFGAVDCTTQKCGIFARFDHLAGTDTSEDQFIPITFAPAGSTTTKPENPVVTLTKQDIAKMPARMKVGAKVALPLQTTMGTTVTYRSASAKICSIAGNVISAKMVGTCKIQAYAPGSSTLEMFAKNISLRIVKK